VSGLGLKPVVADVGMDYRLMPTENHEELGPILTIGDLAADEAAFPTVKEKALSNPTRLLVGLTIDGGHKLMLPPRYR